MAEKHISSQEALSRPQGFREYIAQQWQGMKRDNALIKAAYEVNGNRVVGDALTEMGLVPQTHIEIPTDILLTAVSRGLPNYDHAYIHQQDGTVTYLTGEPVKDRLSEERMTREVQLMQDYVGKLPGRQKALFEAILRDPESDEVDTNYRAGVTRINSRRVFGMEEDCRVAIVIPARYEQDRIMATLEGFANQTDVSPYEYEINVIVNHKDSEQPDETTERVLEFMERYPDLRVNLIDVQWDDAHAKVGYARKIMTDLTLTRALARESYQPLYIISADADETKVDPTIVRKTIDGFDADPVADCLRGRQDRSNALISQHDLCAVKYKAGQIAEVIARDARLRDPYRPGFNFEWNRIVSGGWASAITVESYALIGGYLDTVLGEDVAMGQLVSIARGYWDQAGNVVPFVDSGKRMYVQGESNFLRFGHELVSGLPAYDENEFARQDIKQMSELDILHALKDYTHLNPNDWSNLWRFNNEVRNAFFFLRGIVGNADEFVRVYAPRYMMALGFKREDYDLVKNGDGPEDVDIVIKNWWTFKWYLDQNRAKHKQEFEQTYGTTYP